MTETILMQGICFSWNEAIGIAFASFGTGLVARWLFEYIVGGVKI